MAETSATLTIRTPEGVVFTMKLAGPVSRCMALVIDLAAISAATSVAGSLLRIVGALQPALAAALSLLVFFIISIFYGIVTEWFWQRRTLGKRLFGLRVLDVQGLRLQFSQVVVRNLLRFVDSLPLLYLVGGIACLLSPRSQRLGDLAANTVVVRTPGVPEPALSQILTGKYNSMREHPRLKAHLRQQVTPEAADIALQALLRRDHLEPSARILLFHEIAVYFKSLAVFPPETTEGISDEQVVRNVIDLVFSQRSGFNRAASRAAAAHHG